MDRSTWNKLASKKNDNSTRSKNQGVKVRSGTFTDWNLGALKAILLVLRARETPGEGWGDGVFKSPAEVTV